MIYEKLISDIIKTARSKSKKGDLGPILLQNNIISQAMFDTLEKRDEMVTGNPIDLHKHFKGETTQENLPESFKEVLH